MGVDWVRVGYEAERAGYSISRKDGFSLGFEHPHLGAAEMVAIQRRLYHQAFERLGPSIYRVAEDCERSPRRARAGVSGTGRRARCRQAASGRTGRPSM